MRNAYKILVGIPELGELIIDWKIILRQICVK
jgi:hypothetical protein